MGRLSAPSARSGLAHLHLATALLAGTALFPKLIALPADEIVALRSLVAAVALFLFARVAGVDLGAVRREHRGMVALVGVLTGAHWVLFFYSVQLTTVAIGLICLFTFPVMVVFLEPLVSRERIEARDVAMAAAVVVGVWLVVPEATLENPVTLGAALGLLSALLYALRTVLYRQHLKEYPSSAMMFYQVAIAALVLCPLLFDGVDVASEGRWLYLLVLGVVFTALPHTLMVHSLRSLRAKTVSLIASLQPFYGALLAAVLLAEIPDPGTVAGGVVIVAAAAYESVRAREG